MKIASNRFLSVCIPALALGLLFSYGCGGGSGGQSGSSNQEFRRVLDSVASEAERHNAHEEISEASGNYPKAGSVVQSSNASGGVTTDSTSVEASYESGQIRYRVQNSSAGWSVDSSVDTVLQRFSGTATTGWDGVELMKRLSGGNLYVDVYSESRVRQNEDYVAGGLWIYVPDSADKIEDLNLGVFGDGNDPFRQSDLSALNGTETYRGDAVLLYSDGEHIYFAEAKVALTVDFDRGTVKGRIHSFVDEDGEHVPGREVLLEESSIGSSDSGFFRGETDLEDTTASNLEGEGKWGGQFSGNGSGTLPRIAGGTFGIATADGEETALGVWSALNPNPRTTPPRNEPTTNPSETVDVPSHPRATDRLSPGPFTPGRQYSWTLSWNRVPGATSYKVHVNSAVTPTPVSGVGYRRSGEGCVVTSADYSRTTSSTTHIYRFTAPNAPGERINFRGLVQACNSAGCSCPPDGGGGTGGGGAGDDGDGTDDTTACRVGLRLMSGESCSYNGGRNTITNNGRQCCIDDSICAGRTLSFNNVRVSRNGGVCVIDGLP